MRMQAELRKKQIINAGIIAAEKGNYATVSRPEVAEIANCSVALITHYFPTVLELRKAVLKEAVAQCNETVILQAMINRDKFIDGVPRDVLRGAVRWLGVN
jgi:AcrR family transcriptional regulator